MNIILIGFGQEIAVGVIDIPGDYSITFSLKAIGGTVVEVTRKVSTFGNINKAMMEIIIVVEHPYFLYKYR
jgi:hypothetical protein